MHADWPIGVGYVPADCPTGIYICGEIYAFPNELHKSMPGCCSGVTETGMRGPLTSQHNWTATRMAILSPIFVSRAS